jgi:hypothetical protein
MFGEGEQIRSQDLRFCMTTYYQVFFILAGKNLSSVLTTLESGEVQAPLMYNCSYGVGAANTPPRQQVWFRFTRKGLKD